MTKMDVAFADVIIEGKIVAVQNNRRFVAADDQNFEINDYTYLFEVIEVRRGNLYQQIIEVGITESGRYTPPRSVDEFIETYDDHVRLGLYTPALSQKFCTVEKQQGSESDQADISCSEFLLRYVEKFQRPIVFGAACGEVYIFPLDEYNKSREYLEKYKRFDEKRISENLNETEAKALYDEIIGDVSPLPWHRNYKFADNSENRAVDLFKRNIAWFTEGEESFESDMELLKFLGMNFDEVDDSSQINNHSKFEQSYSSTAIYGSYGEYGAFGDYYLQDEYPVLDKWAIERLAKTVRKIKDYIEIDPSFADRLLDSD